MQIIVIIQIYKQNLLYQVTHSRSNWLFAIIRIIQEISIIAMHGIIAIIAIIQRIKQHRHVQSLQSCWSRSMWVRKGLPVRCGMLSSSGTSATPSGDLTLMNIHVNIHEY